MSFDRNRLSTANNARPEAEDLEEPERHQGDRYEYGEWSRSAVSRPRAQTQVFKLPPGDMVQLDLIEPKVVHSADKWPVLAAVNVPQQHLNGLVVDLGEWCLTVTIGPPGHGGFSQGALGISRPVCVVGEESARSNS